MLIPASHVFREYLSEGSKWHCLASDSMSNGRKSSVNAVRPVVFVLGHGREIRIVFRFGFVFHFQDVEQGFQAARFVGADLLWVVVAEVFADRGDRGGEFGHGAACLGPQHAGVKISTDPNRRLQFVRPHGTGVTAEEQAAQLDLLGQLNRATGVEKS